MNSSSIRDRIRELRRVPVQQLVPHSKNWRFHPQAQKDAFAALRSEIGFAGVLLVRELKDGRYQILDGHMRAAMTPDGLVPVVVLDLTDAEAEKLLLTYDPLAALAETDFERLKALLETVQTDSEAVQELLRRTAGDPLWAVLHPEELKPAEVAPDRAEELRAKWCTELGQIWQLGPHRLMCADSREKRNIQWLFNATRAIRLIVTDSPYGVSYASKNSYLNRSDRGTRIQKPIRNDSLAPNEIRDLFQASLQGAIAFALPGAACYASVPSGPLLPYFIAGFEGSGFSFKHLLVWVKQHFVIGMSDYHYRHEAILYGWIENGPHYFVDDRTQDSVFEIDRPMASELHPTTKPVELIGKMIANSSRPGEVVYDPFCGSGSTLVAAQQLGRIGYGIELDPGYVAVALERLSMLGLKPELEGER